MINLNLTNLHQFFDRYISKFNLEELEKNRSSQLKVRYSSREFEDKILSGKFEAEFRISTKKLSYLSSTYKLYVYILLRLIKIYTDSSYFSLIFEDYVSYLEKRTFSNNERYFYLSQLTDEQFAYEIDTELWYSKSRRNFYRLVNSKIRQRNNISLLEMTIEIISSADFVLLPKTKPKRLQRHKGYRDHGSLGSDFSKTLKDQSNDYTIKEEEELRRKTKQDFLDLLNGFAGWE